MLPSHIGEYMLRMVLTTHFKMLLQKYKLLHRDLHLGSRKLMSKNGEKFRIHELLQFESTQKDIGILSC